MEVGARGRNYYFIRGTLLISSSLVAIVVSPSWLLSGRVYGSAASTPALALHVRVHVCVYRVFRERCAYDSFRIERFFKKIICLK